MDDTDGTLIDTYMIALANMNEDGGAPGGQGGSRQERELREQFGL